MGEGERKLFWAAGAVFFLNLTSRLLGFLRDVAIAHTFGASAATDAYLVAYSLPYALQAILGTACVAAVVPVLSPFFLQGKEKEGWQVCRSLFTYAFLGFTFFALVGIFFAPQLVALLAPGFSRELFVLTTRLTQIMFPSLIFTGVGMLATGVLNTRQVFNLPAFAPAFTNLIIIGSIIVFSGPFWVYGLAWGTLAAFVGFWAIQLPALHREGFTFTPAWEWSPPVRQTFQNLGPVVLAVAVNQLYLISNRYFASSLSAGSITALDFSYRVVNLPLGVFVAAISTVIFPTLAVQATCQDWPGLKKTLARSLGVVLLFAVPTALGLAFFRTSLIRLLFERGAFDVRATSLTAAALFAYAPGLVGWAVSLVVPRAFYAGGDFLTPVVTGMVSVGLNLILSIFLLPLFGHAGLALANSLAALTNAALLLVFLPRYFLKREAAEQKNYA